MKKEKFKDRDEREFYYDNLPLLSANVAEERKLLAAMTYEAVPDDKKPAIQGSWAVADSYRINDQVLDSMKEVSRIYDSAFKTFEEMRK
jgi:hypothetical protein